VHFNALYLCNERAEQLWLTATCRTLIRYNTARSAFSALVGLLIMTRHPYHINWTIRYRVGHFYSASA